MIGVGVSIDYSLFILTRFREELARGAAAKAGPIAVPDAVGTRADHEWPDGRFTPARSS